MKGAPISETTRLKLVETQRWRRAKEKAMAEEPNEFRRAQILADCVLEKPFIDPDGDICMLARQFQRLCERLESIAKISDHKPGGRTVDEVMRDFDAIHFIAKRGLEMGQ
jgi:hypothetical protein